MIHAASPLTQPVALALAAIAAALSPLVLRFVPLDGVAKVAACYALALAISLLASWLTGDISLSRVSIVDALLGSAGLWAIQHTVYQALQRVRPTLVGKAAPTA